MITISMIPTWDSQAMTAAHLPVADFGYARRNRVAVFGTDAATAKAPTGSPPGVAAD